VAYDWKTELPGVFSRHADSCPARDGGECTCGPLGYRSSVRDWQTNERSVGPTFETAVEALAWQRDQLVRETPSPGTVGRGDLGAVIDEFLQAAEDGMARNGTDGRYTRESVRALRGALSYAESELGTMDIQDIRRRHIQSLIDQLHASGVLPARIVAVADALHELYAYAIRHDLVGFSPMVELELPQSQNGVAHDTPSPFVADAARPTAQASDELRASPTVVEPPWTPPPFDLYDRNAGSPPPPSYAPPAPPYPGHTADYRTPPPQWPPPGYATEQQYPPQTAQRPYGFDSTTFTGIFTPPMGQPSASYDATMQERWLWWTVRIIVIVFVLIALVLVAESV
jgi:hypothetical protein